MQRDPRGIEETATRVRVRRFSRISFTFGIIQARNTRNTFVLFLAFALLPLVGITAPIPAAIAENPPRKILTGWIPYYRTYSSPGKQNGGLDSSLASADLIKEVMPFWYSLDSATKVTDLYSPANPNSPINDTLNKIRQAGYLIIPTITDSTASKDPKTGKMATMVLSNLLADSAKRDLVVQTITQFVLTNNFDGIDLDFENFAYVDGTSSWATTQIRFIAFMKSLATALHAQGKLLSLTSPPLFDPVSGKKGYWVYAWADLGSTIDRLRIMTYDYSTSNPGPIGPITWVEQTVQYAISVMPASKVFIGLPGYGRDWVTSVQGVCPSTPINYLATVKPTASAGTFVMRDAATLASTYGAVPLYQPKFGETTFTYQKVYNGNTTDGQLTQCTATRVVWYQDAQGFALRANLVGKYRLGGLSQWTLGMEDPAATEAIRTVAKSIAPDVVVSNLSTNVPATIYGGVSNLAAIFTLPDKKPLAGLPIRLEIKTATTDWTQIFTGTTTNNGSINVSIIVAENTKARMISDATWERSEGRTPEVLLQTGRKLSWTAVPPSAKRGIEFTLTGKISPAPLPADALTVTLSDGAKMHKSIPVDSSGVFSTSLVETTPGIHTYQISSTPSDRYLASSSDFVTVVVR